MLETISRWLAVPTVRAAVILFGSILSAFVIERCVHRVLLVLAKKTATELDDKIIAILRRPIFLSAIFLGLHWASNALGKEIPDSARQVLYSVIYTLVVALWAMAVGRSGTLVLGAMSKRAREGSLLQPSSLPLFDIVLKIAAVGTAVYLVFLAWHLDLTAWMASAGILGVAIGFGAKDSLANLFAGIFIIADAPYKVGDVIVLDDSLRGRVTNIGIRSTRILTLDNIEVIVPNGIIGNSRIVNEAGGPSLQQRMRVNVSIAYGSDIDQAREVLLSCCEAVEGVCTTRTPQVRFVAFGASGLDLALLAWVANPEIRDAVLDRLNTRIYKSLGAADIEIPYDKLDLYIKETVDRRDAA